jgi:hypothetical protein
VRYVAEVVPRDYIIGEEARAEVLNRYFQSLPKVIKDFRQINPSRGRGR